MSIKEKWEALLGALWSRSNSQSTSSLVNSSPVENLTPCFKVKLSVVSSMNS